MLNSELNSVTVVNMQGQIITTLAKGRKLFS